MHRGRRTALPPRSVFPLWHYRLLCVLLALLPMLLHSFRRRFSTGADVRKNFRRVFSPSLCAVDADVDADHDASSSILKERVKRKVALVCSYVGSNYFGLQMDINSTLPTIERCLSDALFKAGCIAPSNAGNLAKIGWSRSSRTDKGVHASRIVISAKLEIDERNWLVGRDLKAPTIARMVNQHLPSDIRVFAAAKMNQGFRARESCHFREYEYLLPLHLLTGESSEVPTIDARWKHPPKSGEQALAELNEIFLKMRGTKSHHNYHKLSPKSLKSKDKGRGAGAEDDDDESESERESESDAKEAAPAVPYSFSNFQPWPKRPRDTCYSKTRCTIYHFQAEEVREIDGVEMVCIRIRGQAFLLHQIRLLIGSSILVTRGIMPSNAIDAAFLLPFHINFPLAPAEGLVLVNAGFSRNANGKTVAISGVQGSDADYVIMETEEHQASEEWKRGQIYPKVAADWSRNDSHLAREFLYYAERFRVPQSVEEDWATMSATYLEKEQKEDTVKDQRESSRIYREVVFFRRELLERDESFADFFHLAHDETSSKIPHKRSQPIPHKKLLPNSIATELVIHYNVQPSSVAVSDALRALATKMVLATAEDDLNPGMTNKEVIAFIETKGGLDYWAALPKHCMIE